MESLRTNGRRGNRIMRQVAQAVIETMEPRQLLAASIQFVADLDPNSWGNIGSITDYKGKALIENWNDSWYISGGSQGSTVLLHKATAGFLDEVVATPNKAFGRFWQDTGLKHDLWATDGTVAGTVKITPAGLDDDAGAHTAIGNKLFFAGRSATDTADHPWVSDGTAAGTIPLSTIPLASSVKPVALNGNWYFLGGSGLQYSLYRTDGTPAGTSKVWDLPTGNAPSTLGVVGGKVLVPMFGHFFLVTPAGAATDLPNMYFTDEIVTIGNVAYFNAEGPGNAGIELWRTDGTAGGTALVKDIKQGSGWSNPEHLLKVGSRVMFIAGTDVAGDEWWISDGTPDGTYMAGEVAAGTAGLNRSTVNLYGATSLGNSVYYPFSTAAEGLELWRADGSGTGTAMVQDLYTGTMGSSPISMAVVGSSLYFGATDGTYHDELFRYTPPVVVNAPPAASISGVPSASVGTAPMTIQILWTDTEGVNTASLGNGDISVTLPNGTTVAATYVSYSGNPTSVVATYQVAAPTGGWDSTYTGTYQVTAAAGQVTDVQGLGNTGGAVGAFTKDFAASISLQLTGRSVAENLPAGTAVGTLGVSGNGGTITYALVSGAGSADNASFTISGNQLLTAAAFDFETKSSYSIRIRASGSNGATDEQAYTISVTDVTESGGQALTNITLTSTSVAEKQPAGTVVGILGAVDSTPNATFTFTLAGGSSAVDNSKFTIVGNELRTAAVFDRSQAEAYWVRIRVADQAGASYEKTFAILIADAPEPAGTFGMVNGKLKTLVLPVDGDLVTFKLTGGGTGTLDTNGSISLLGTTAKSALTISVKKSTGGDGVYTISGISADGLLKSIAAPQVFVHGNIVTNSTAAAVGASTLTATLAGVTDGSMDTHGLPIRSLKMLDWQDTDANPDQVKTPWIGSITVTGRKDLATTPGSEALAGDWGADVLTTAANAGVAIGTVKVAGSVAGAKLWANGAIKSITASHGVTGSRIAASANIGTISTTELHDSDVLVGVSAGFSDHYADSAGAFTTPAAKLSKLMVTGYKLPAGQTHPAYITNSHISAATYGTVSLANVPVTTPQRPILHVLTDTGTLMVKSLSSGMVASGVWKGGVARPGQAPRPNLVKQLS